jgi:hypothetical protein
MVNADFDGARALFILGTITVGGNMSIVASYDTSAVSPEDSETFARVFERILVRLVESDEKIKIGDLRQD